MDDARLDSAGISLFAVETRVGEDQAPLAFPLDGRGVPQHLVEAALTAVEVVRPVVRRELVCLPIQLKSALRYSIRVPPDDRAEIGMAPRVLLDGVESQCNIGEFAVRVR